MTGGGTRCTRNPVRTVVDRNPPAASKQAIIPNDRKNRLSPALTATAPTNRVASRNHHPSRVGGSLRFIRARGGDRGSRPAPVPLLGASAPRHPPARPG